MTITKAQPLAIVLALLGSLLVSSPALAQSDLLITRTLRPQAGVCRKDLYCSPMLRLSKLLLSREGSIEVESRWGLFTVTDRVENLEAIDKLFESYHDLDDATNESKYQRSSENEAAIRAVLDAQAAAWNRGDVEGYMDGYDRSPNTEFVGGDSITRGWQEVLDRYKKKYDTREKMGTLTFTDLEINILSGDAALVLGRWRLKRASDEPHGTFTLLFRKTKAGWRIVHDHSSSA